MADYSTSKVADLKAELKRRGIPQTGLRVKQQIIDKLMEDDNKGQDAGSGEAATAAEPEPEEESHPPEPEAPVATETEDNVEVAPTQDTAPSAPDTQAELNTQDEKPAEDPDQPSQKLDGSAEHLPSHPQTEEPSEETQEPEEKDTKAESDEKKYEAEESKPIEQAPGETVRTEPVIEEPSPAGLTTASGPQSTGADTELSTPLPSEELIEDVRKRKRRSQSPAPHLEQVSRKKAKTPGDSDSQPGSEARDPTSAGTADEIPKPSEISQTPIQEDSSAQRNNDSDKTQTKKATPQKQDPRFKELIISAGREDTRPSPPPVSTEVDEAMVEPAIHAATAAIYIDGLMRPLQPAALKNHLLNVASAPGTSPNPDLVTEFYLDSIKTHCFAKFSDVSTASRARGSLHGTVWPNEKNRKSLFVDYIPEHKVHDWIQMEEATRGRPGPPPRWEVKYDKRGDEVVAVLEEVDLTSSARAPTTKEFTHPPPRGPRAEMQSMDRRPSGPSQQHRSSHPGQGFKPLDELFKSTTAKPKLYYLPVPREVADKRLDRFDDLIQEGSFPRRGGDEMRKISFEDDDRFIDSGPEFAPRGRGGGRGRGRGRGGIMDSRRYSRRDRY